MHTELEIPWADAPSPTITSRRVALALCVAVTAVAVGGLFHVIRSRPALAMQLAETGVPPTGSSPGVAHVALEDTHPMQFVALTGGSFDLGPSYSALRVDVAPFEISTTEVTQAQWRAVMGPKWFSFRGAELPAHDISWCAALEFANALSVREGLTPAYDLSAAHESAVHGRSGVCDAASWDRQADGYRLPTSAEWEYAAIANRPLPDVRISGWSLSLGWTLLNARDLGRRTGPRPVGTLEANDWGLFDTTGNVWEWVWGRYRAPQIRGEAAAAQGHDWDQAPDGRHVVRGCAWNSGEDRCRVDRARQRAGGGRGNTIGLRLARSAR